MKNVNYREERLRKFSEHLKEGVLIGERNYYAFFERVVQKSKSEKTEEGEQIYLMPIFELPYIFDS